MVDEGWQLSRLGWRAFQDLCVAILTTVFGQTVEPFEDGNDEGRDGSFTGQWVDSLTREELSGRFVVQVKHSSRDRTLSLSDVAGELPKIESLHRRGLCDNYVLMTNCRVTGQANAAITEAIRDIGVSNVRVWARTWVEDKLSSSSDLRRRVPRVYGLGDLGEILDDRRRMQAAAILHALGSSTSTFVPTTPYGHAVGALDKHRAVLLLGGPTVGKSVIAQMLALGAIDAGGMDVVKATSAAEFLEAWNPNNPNRLYWVDDVFGELTAEPSLLDAWSRHMSALLAAREQGNRFVFTSRDYVYREALRRLKEANVRFWDDARIDVLVAALSPTERQLILYNHMKLGNQTTEFKRKIKPHLEHVSGLASFTPGLAFRLGNQRFTDSLDPSDRSAVISFFEDPTTYLDEIVNELSTRDRAALALLFATSGELHLPLQDAERARALIVDLGASLEEVGPSLESLEGTFVKSERLSVGTVWTFAHPTIREATNRYLQSGAATVASIIRATPTPDLIRQVDLRQPDAIPTDERGRRLIVGVADSPAVIAAALEFVHLPEGREWRIRSDLLDLLAHRATAELRAQFSAGGSRDLQEWALQVNWSRDAHMLIGLMEAEGSLPRDARSSALETILEAARELRSTVWSDTAWMSVSEVDAISNEIRDVLREPDNALSAIPASYDASSDPEGFMEDYWSAVSELRDIFAGEPVIQQYLDLYESGLELAAQQVTELSEYRGWDDDDDEVGADTPLMSAEQDSRSIFEDVDL
jgi:hypothetical protein